MTIPEPHPMAAAPTGGTRPSALLRVVLVVHGIITLAGALVMIIVPAAIPLAVGIALQPNGYLVVEPATQGWTFHLPDAPDVQLGGDPANASAIALYSPRDYPGDCPAASTITTGHTAQGWPVERTASGTSWCDRNARVGVAVWDKKLVATCILVHSSFHGANVAVESSRRIRFQLRRARSHPAQIEQDAPRHEYRSHR